MNLSSSFLRMFCIGATLMSVQGQVRGRDLQVDKGQDRGQNENERFFWGGDKCWTCEQSRGCFECLSLSDNGDGSATVELDFSECKNKLIESIGWACCTGSSGADGVFNEGECEVPDAGCFGFNNRARDPEAGSPKCNRVSTMFVMVPSDATSVDINTFDRFTGNDATPLTGAHPICAGILNRGGPCARNNGVTSYCLETIDLSSCPTTGTLPTPTVAPSAGATESSSLSPTVAPSAGATESSSLSPTVTDDLTSVPSLPTEASSIAPTAGDTIVSDPPSLVPAPTSASSVLPTLSSSMTSDVPSLLPSSDMDTTSDTPSTLPTDMYG